MALSSCQQKNRKQENNLRNVVSVSMLPSSSVDVLDVASQAQAYETSAVLHPAAVLLGIKSPTHPISGGIHQLPQRLAESLVSIQLSNFTAGSVHRSVSSQFILLKTVLLFCFNPSTKMSSRKTAGRRGTTKKRAQRATSNVFAMFDQAQIQEFKEAFNMIDQNRDGFVDKEDLHDMLASLGKNPTDEYLEAMMNEAPGPINFTMFLTLFGEKLQGTDPEEVIKNAFGCFDEENTGFLNEERLRELLTTMGDRFTDEDVDEMYREAPIKKSMFDYLEFTRILKHGAIDKDD
ncbi:hypothetical protein OUZ56_009620 [Daphnia magna]|nr:hypothetical protein OUZ56_009620 [Daphnia magna]